MLKPARQVKSTFESSSVKADMAPESAIRRPIKNMPGPSPSAQAGPSNTKPKKDEKERQRIRMKTNALRRKKQDDELKALQSLVDSFVPPAAITSFSQLPLSSRTQLGLKSAHFAEPTPIQALSLPATLKNHDVLGSARTGSGKTLAFLIPMLERLFRERWGPMDGLGAVVISPTRELAIQTFQTLRSLGQHHTFSAGLIIGGKPLQEERDRLSRMNILIATPGRLLQHFDSTVGLETSQVKVLVLDEADRLMDLGFMPTLKAIVNHLGDGKQVERQTLLFSATQSPDLVALAKLSLREPMYINVNKPGEEGVMPAKLEQYYSVVPLDRKLDALWGFVKSHLKMKGVVFVSSCKQVRYVFETFRKLHPGLPLMHLHGKQKQPTRLEIFQRFSSTSTALLICTDIASRGLDFPAVDWVIQLDCPEDVDMYIHRVGRTARYQSEGKGLCLLLPSEEDGMKKRWEGKGIEVKKIKIKESKMGNLAQQMQGFAFRDPEIKYLGQRAFISYLKSIHIQKDKTVFDLSALPIEAYAASLGLPGAPQIRFITDAREGKAVKQAKNQARGSQVQEEVAPAQVALAKGNKVNAAGETEVPTSLEGLGSDADAHLLGASSEEDSETEEEDSGSEVDVEEVSTPVMKSKTAVDVAIEADDKPVKTPAVRTKYDRMFERKNQGVLTSHYNAMITHDDVAGSGDEEDDFLTIGQRDHTLADVGLDPIPASGSAPTLSLTEAELSKRKIKQGESKKAMLKLKGTGHKLTFDDAGESHEVYEMQGEEDFRAGGEAADLREAYVRGEMERMREADVVDREVAKEKRAERKRKRKEREREVMAEELAGLPTLGGGDSDSESDSASDGDISNNYPSRSAVDTSEETESGTDEEEEDAPRARKRARKDVRVAKEVTAEDEEQEEEEEALALRLLQAGR